ncbi:S1C family serine protease [Gracilibacillus sp. S3-1-1]|uniref:S1C family serine protease n=1 Tax=Gracilibacillus pellucidus TaxID=3095368 RepID=A0ACC6M1M7_9BACI|nr:S1C family serine protease [Gracilibacillus sp. S3-1-1]MDX8044859.1 S1C family serine protease [Gracilibacillus sp. S3-1-1]
MYINRKYIPILLATIIGMIAIVIAIILFINMKQQPLDVENTIASELEKDQEMNLKNIIHQAQKSVVQIESTNDLTTKTGSGFVINNKGDIVTNAHVIEEADSIIVKLANAREYPAAIVGIGENQDFAVIRVQELAQLEPITIETDLQLDIGDEIVAIGSPMGIQNSVSLGLIVGTDRSFTINDFQYEDVYQISANITHGNSGGPLILRSNGKVVGINSAGITDTDVGFSIPITQIINTINEWIDNVEEDNLTYLSPDSQVVNEEKLKEDASYLTDYFLDNLKLRDYVNAYSLLGSHYQKETNYTDFSQLFQSLIDLSVEDKTVTEVHDDHVSMNITIEISKRDNEYNEVDESRQYELIAGYENDQMKILQLTEME